MATTMQINVRAPESARAILLKIGARLREDANFGARLAQWLAEIENPSVAAHLAERLDQLEARIEVLESERGAERVPAATPERVESTPPRDATDTPPLPGIVETTAPAAEATWTVGTGRGTRLSVFGEAELRRLVLAGENDAAIAKALGVRPFTVKNRREKLNLPTEQPSEE